MGKAGAEGLLGESQILFISLSFPVLKNEDLASQPINIFIFQIMLLTGIKLQSQAAGPVQTLPKHQPAKMNMATRYTLSHLFIPDT